MKVLVNYGWDPLETSESGKTLLRVLVTRGVVSVTQYLLSFGVSPSLDLLHAASNGPEKSSMVVCLVENGANVHARTASGDPVLQTALQSFGFGEWNDGRALETTRVLVNHGCDPLEASPSGDTALHIAIERGFLSVARFLFSLGISPSPDLLHIALERGHTSTIVCLLESGTNVHARTAAGDSVLHIALQSISEEEYTLRIAKILVCHGCNLLEASSSGETALDIAVRRGFVSVVRYITSLQVGIVPSCNLVLVAFKLGSRNKPKRIPMLRSLLDGGANVHARTATGRSVLHIALRTFRNEKTVLKVAKILICGGCSPRSQFLRRNSAPHCSQTWIWLSCTILPLSRRVPPLPICSIPAPQLETLYSTSHCRHLRTTTMLWKLLKSSSVMVVISLNAILMGKRLSHRCRTGACLPCKFSSFTRCIFRLAF